MTPNLQRNPLISKSHTGPKIAQNTHTSLSFATLLTTHVPLMLHQIFFIWDSSSTECYIEVEIFDSRLVGEFLETIKRRDVMPTVTNSSGAVKMVCKGTFTQIAKVKESVSTMKDRRTLGDVVKICKFFFLLLMNIPWLISSFFHGIYNFFSCGLEWSNDGSIHGNIYFFKNMMGCLFVKQRKCSVFSWLHDSWVFHIVE